MTASEQEVTSSMTHPVSSTYYTQPDIIISDSVLLTSCNILCHKNTLIVPSIQTWKANTNLTTLRRFFFFSFSFFCAISNRMNNYRPTVMPDNEFAVGLMCRQGTYCVDRVHAYYFNIGIWLHWDSYQHTHFK